MSNTIKIAITVPLLLSTTALYAHHGVFYKEVYRAIENADLDSVQDWFTKSAWQGKESAMSAKQLQERLSRGRVRGLFENSLHDEQRSKCLVAFKLQYSDETVEPIWLLAEDFDPRIREWDWRIVRIVNEEQEAQAFFKHSYSREFASVEKEFAKPSSAKEHHLPTQCGRGAFSPDGDLLAVAEGGRTIRLFDPRTGELVRELDRKKGSELEQLAWRPDGKVLASGGDDTVLHDLKTGEILSRLELSAGKRLAWSPDGKKLVGVSYRSIQCWDADTQQIRNISSDDVYFWSAALSPDGGQVATIGEYGKVHLWDLETGENELASVKYGSCECFVDWNPRTGMLALSGHRTGRPFPGRNIVRVWNPTSGEVEHDWSAPDKGALLAWSPDGKTLAVATGWYLSRWSSSAPPAKIALWDANTGQPHHILQTDEQQVNFLAWSPDGTWLASGGPRLVYELDEDREIRSKSQLTRISLWSRESGKLIRRFGR